MAGPRRRLVHLISWTLCVLRCVLVAADPLNVTVDDSSPDLFSGQKILYIPVSYWAVGQDCSTCAAQPQASRTHAHTWHDTTYSPPPSDRSQLTSVIFTFVGTALYVYGVLAFQQSAFASTTQLLLSVDEQSYGNFSFLPSGQTDFTYDVPFFAVESLSYGPHTMVLQNGVPDTNVSSLLIFDYLIYTTDINGTSTMSPTTPTAIAPPQQPSGSPSSNIGRPARHEAAVVAAVVLGALLGLVVVANALVFYRRSRQETSERSATTYTPPMTSTNPYTLDLLHPGRGLSQTMPTTRQHEQQAAPSQISSAGAPPPYPATELSNGTDVEMHRDEPPVTPEERNHGRGRVFGKLEGLHTHPGGS